MATQQKIDRGLAGRLDEFEERLFHLKIAYEKFFLGIDKKEPVQERDMLQRMLRDLLNEPVNNTSQKHKLKMLQARMGSQEYYITRQLFMLERGIHPRQRFRAEMNAKHRNQSLEWEERKAAIRARSGEGDAAREEQMFQAVYKQFMETRKDCGQPSNLPYDQVRDVLRKQVVQIREKYQCDGVRFRIAVEEGKAKVRAIPLKKREGDADPG